MPGPKTYHHGDLRGALLTAAREKLTQGGYEALSLRELARDIGVARSAPYFHFKNRDDLLWALVAEGSDDLQRLFSEAAALALSPQERLAAACRAYLAFGREQPELLRLMMVSPLTSERIRVAAADRALEVFDLLVAQVMTAPKPVRVQEVSIGCWSAMHGFAMLRLHNRISPDVDAEAMGEAVIQAVVRQARTA